MLLTKFLKIKINNRNIKRYLNINKNININDIIEIPINFVNHTNKQKVECICDICGKQNKISYIKYLININKNKKYVCYDCRKILIKNTIINRYGVDNVSKLDFVKEKRKNTCLNKYGVDNPQKNKIVKEKSEKTNLKKYGFKNVFQNENIKNKIKNNYNEKYNVDYPSQVENIVEKRLKNSLKISYYKNSGIYYQSSYELDFFR
jgi:hypothetical protein